MIADARYEQLLKDLQRFIVQPREGWILTPTVVGRPLSLSDSKFGGWPYPGKFEEWPRCPGCHLPLNFIIQLERRRVPQMWFPPAKNLFQVFRCPNSGCRPKNFDESDHCMLGLYVQTEPGKRQPLECPTDPLPGQWPRFEPPVDEHELTVEKIDDYPSFYEGRVAWWGDSWIRFQDKYTSTDSSNDNWFYDGPFWRLIRNHEGIKIAGLPSWQQTGYPPKCQCGRTKEFIFQLCSFCLGDDANIYYFVCRGCGENSLETCWDCG